VANAAVGTLTALWRFPVKSMLGERVADAHVDERGVVGDRAYGLVERATGKVVSAKNAKAYPTLLQCRASFVAAPQHGAEAPPVRIELPNGQAVASDAPDASAALSRFFGRDVELRRAAPADFTIDECDLDPATGDVGAAVAKPLGSALWAKLGTRSPVPVGAFFDAFPLSLLTTATLARLGELRPQTRFDVQRFRMNMVFDTPAPGFVENAWVGCTVEIGEALRVRVVMPDPRCVITTLEQADLPRDVEVLRTLAAHNRLPFADNTEKPCAGVYGVIVAPGSVATGDPVRFV
jgi:uncharacterized protein YcbX